MKLYNCANLLLQYYSGESLFMIIIKGYLIFGYLIFRMISSNFGNSLRFILHYFPIFFQYSTDNYFISLFRFEHAYLTGLAQIIRKYRSSLMSIQYKSVTELL